MHYEPAHKYANRVWQTRLERLQRDLPDWDTEVMMIKFVSFGSSDSSLFVGTIGAGRITTRSVVHVVWFEVQGQKRFRFNTGPLGNECRLHE